MVERSSYCPSVVEQGTRTGMPILTDVPRQVGGDRIVNAVAAYDLVGDAIAPDIEISADAGRRVAVQIQKVELSGPPSAVDKCTHESVRAVVVFGTAAIVDGMVERMQKELGGAGRMLTLHDLGLIYERNVEAI